MSQRRRDGMEADVGKRKRLEEVMQLSLKITGGTEVK